MSEREMLAALIQSSRYSGRIFPAENPLDFRDADRILAAGFGDKAEAWDEGAEAHRSRYERDESLPLTNPYRKATA